MSWTPEWVKDAVFYQIFPDRFAKSIRVAKPNNLEPWGQTPTMQGYQGGDLLGVAERLDYLQDLGVNAIYFCPIFQSASNHRYHTHDYYRVDPMLGGDTAFHELRDQAHARGMRIVLDGVFNHSSRGFFQFNDILENGERSAYVDWFSVNAFPPNAYDTTSPAGYAAWWGLHALPKFNVHNPQVREFLLRVAEYWIRQGADGWRLDVPEEISAPGFWEEFRARVKAINPEAYIVGEIWRTAPDWLAGTRFDATMNYPFTEAVIGFTAEGKVEHKMLEGKGYNPAPALDGRGYMDRITGLLRLYPWDVSLVQLNLLDSHDTPRMISLVMDDVSAVRLAALLMFTSPGVPCIYYGDEIGLPGGGPDYDARRAFPWDKPNTWNLALREHYQLLTGLRKQHIALRRGGFHPLHAEHDVVAFGRWYEHDRLIVAVNRSDTAVTVSLDPRDLGQGVEGWRAVYGHATGLEPQAGTLPLRLPARDGVVLAPVGG